MSKIIVRANTFEQEAGNPLAYISRSHDVDYQGTHWKIGRGYLTIYNGKKKVASYVGGSWTSIRVVDDNG